MFMIMAFWSICFIANCPRYQSFDTSIYSSLLNAFLWVCMFTGLPEGVMVQCINHTSIMQEPPDNGAPQMAEQTANKGCTTVCINSGASKWTFMNHKGLCQDDFFASQSPTPMVAHGKLTNGCLVERKLEKLWMALAAANALNSPQRRWDHMWQSSNTRGVNCKVCWTHGDFRL